MKCKYDPDWKTAPVKCNYDDWKTAVVKNITPKMRAVLKVMAGGQPQRRTDMLREAGIDPNPKSATGQAGFEKTDYYLYKRDLIRMVGIDRKQKIFVITNAGRDALRLNTKEQT